MIHPTYTPETKARLVAKIKTYFAQELDEEIGQFDAEFLLEFMGNLIGGAYYNQGLHDAAGIFEAQADRFREALFAMEEDTS